MILTVIMRNDAPMGFMQEPVLHRTVHVELTPEQVKALEPRYTGTNCGQKMYEEIAQCFIEPEPSAPAGKGEGE